MDLNETVTPSLQLWEIVTAFVLPLVISVIVQSTWSQRAQAFVAFGVSIVATLIQLYLRDGLDNFTDPATSVLTVLALSISFYKGFWKPTGISPAIEHGTDLKKE